MKYADLHVHSMFSDGTNTVEELVSGSVAAGLSAISLVDHDSIDGIAPLLAAAKGTGLEVVPGIELSAEYEGTEIHILGYFIDPQSPALNEKLSGLKANRVERIYKIVQKLKDEMGVELPAESVFATSGGGTVGRMHVARAMVRAGIVRSLTEAFQKYIGDRSPAYVLGFRTSTEEAIGLIRQTGGIPVLAHPYTVDRDEAIPELVAYGLMGLEAYYPEHSQSLVNFYVGEARKYNLLVTGGSDCHGAARPQVRLGGFKVSYEVVERLRAAHEGLRQGRGNV